MRIQYDILLRDFATMRLGGKARALAEVHTKSELTQAVAWAERNTLPLLVLGGGSNVIFSDGFDGLVIINRIAGFEVLEHYDNGALVRVGAGENWDGIVARTVDMGLSGLERLSAIPGTAGATPVQNVGAYGVEIADVFVDLEAYDLMAKKFVTLTKTDCQFSYRHSIFKSLRSRRHIITSITLRLNTAPPRPPFYESLQRYLDKHHINTYTVQTIRDAVIAIRAVTLPDPAKIANTGSFFKNPILSKGIFTELHARYPDIPHWPMAGDKVKIPAGWLLDRAGLKGYRAHGMKIYEQNALVFVNENAKDYADLEAFKTQVVTKVRDIFGITLEQEPELV